MPSPFSSAIQIQTDQLAEILEDERLIPVFVGSIEAFERAHIPGSRHITPAQLVCGVAPAVGKIPAEDDLGLLFSSLGVQPEHTLVAYDDEGGGWAGRLIWTLDVIKHQHYHYLDGGIIAWSADNLPLEKGSAAFSKSNYSATVDQNQLVAVEDIVSNLQKPDFTIWDARSAQEHCGQKVLAAKGGHIPGAVNLDWLDLMDRNNAMRLIPLETIREKLKELGITDDKTVVTHCQTHHRSGLSYLVGKLLGLNIKAYDGSWSEWGNLPDTPVESGTNT